MLTRTLVLLCFFFSGATGLLYEIVWIRLLGLTLGNTYHSITIVVAVFMGGLALGSYLGGRIADRCVDPLKLYGLFILAIGLVCLVVPFLTAAFQPLFGAIYAQFDGNPEAWPLMFTKAVVCAVILLLPTTLMGATLPVLAKYFTRSVEKVGWDFGRLYAVNTIGAVTGAFLTGFYGIALLGLWGCIILAVIIDFVIAGCVFALGWSNRNQHSQERGIRRAKTKTPEAPKPEVVTEPLNRTERWDLRLPVIAFGVSGFANMILQLGWTKAIVGTIGNSTYAFSLIVTLFILGIALGGAIMAAIADRIKNIPYCLGGLLMVTGLAVLLTTWLLGVFPVWGAIEFNKAFQSSSRPNPLTFDKLLSRQVLMVAVTLLVPTTLMGMVFPLVGRWVAREVKSLGRSIGNAYVANTAGAILGTLTAGFFLLPALGHVYATLYISVVLSVLMGLILCLRFSRNSRNRFGSVGAVACILLLAFVTRPYGVLESEQAMAKPATDVRKAWHPAIQSMGVYLYHRLVDGAEGFEEAASRFVDHNRVHYFREGVHGSVAIVEHPSNGKIALRISGKPEGSANRDGSPTNDMPHQLGAAHLPMLLHGGQPKEVLTLGLGSGVTLGALTLYAGESARSVQPPDPERAGVHTVNAIDSLEISSEVVEAVERFFPASNHDATRHPAVRHVLGDGRNHLRYTRKHYDVITSVPSNPWIAGIGNLFTVEFFEIVRERLASGGVFCQWVHSLKMQSEDFKVVLRTLLEVFPENLQLWDLGYDCLLIASPDPIHLDFNRVAAALRDERIAGELKLLGIEEPAQLARHLKFTAEDLKAFCGQGLTNRDFDPCLEFSAPQGLYGHYFDTFNALADRAPSKTFEVWKNASSEETEKVAQLRVGFHDYQQLYSLVHDPSKANRRAELPLYRSISRQDDDWLAHSTSRLSLRSNLAMARLLLLGGKPGRALRLLEDGHRRHGDQLDILQLMGMAYAQEGRPEESVAALQMAVTLCPTAESRALILNDLGKAYAIQQRIPEAIEACEAALKENPGLQLARDNLQRFKASLSDTSK